MCSLQGFTSKLIRRYNSALALNTKEMNMTGFFFSSSPFICCDTKPDESENQRDERKCSQQTFYSAPTPRQTGAGVQR